MNRAGGKRGRGLLESDLPPAPPRKMEDLVALRLQLERARVNRRAPFLDYRRLVLEELKKGTGLHLGPSNEVWEDEDAGVMFTIEFFADLNLSVGVWMFGRRDDDTNEDANERLIVDVIKVPGETHRHGSGRRIAPREAALWIAEVAAAMLKEAYGAGSRLR
jgi:hypothetical protein